MNKVSKLFDNVSSEYDDIYDGSKPKKLLSQEKKVRAAIVEGLVTDLILPTKDKVVVDIGCGIGNVILNLRKNGVKARMYGLDISQGMINIAKNKLDKSGYKDVRFINGSLKDLTFKANVLISIGVIGYQEQQEEFLVELASFIEPNGYLIFTTANGDSVLRFARRFLSKIYGLIKVKKKRYGIKFSSIKDKRVKYALTRLGFKVEKKVYITFGLGLFASSIECYIDRLFLKFFSNGFVGKYISLTVIHVYKKVDYF